MVIESNLEYEKNSFRSKKKSADYYVFKRPLKHESNKQQIKHFLFAGGQEHPEQVQRGGGEEIAHSGGAGICLCI